MVFVVYFSCVICGIRVGESLFPFTQFPPFCNFDWYSSYAAVKQLSIWTVVLVIVLSLTWIRVNISSAVKTVISMFLFQQFSYLFTVNLHAVSCMVYVDGLLQLVWYCWRFIAVRYSVQCSRDALRVEFQRQSLLQHSPIGLWVSVECLTLARESNIARVTFEINTEKL